MRLLDTKTLQFRDFEEAELEVPGNEYAILSHRWAAPDEEPTYLEMSEGVDISHKNGYKKLKAFCDLAARLNYRYAWSDTCCIRKSDSSELTEAIVSMYRWYQRSHLCVVYLEDVPERKQMDSEWFDRGWTLQELIAPKAISFFDRSWQQIGTKDELLNDISEKTGIPVDVLSHQKSPSQCSIAQRMSWAARRKTTRLEDRAYSLFGLFDVNIPHIYGERENAFLRLSSAIIQKSRDESIFAWAADTERDKSDFTGLYAPSPSSYADCGNIVSTRGSTGFSEANGELNISLQTFPQSMETYYAILNCTVIDRPDSRISILISNSLTESFHLRVNKTYRGGRVTISSHVQGKFQESRLCIPLKPIEGPLNRVYGFWLRTIKPPGLGTSQPKMLSKIRTLETDRVCLDDNDWGTAGVVYIAPPPENPQTRNFQMDFGWSHVRWIKLGFDREFNPMILIANGSTKFARTGEGSGQHKPRVATFELAASDTSETEARKEIFSNKWIEQEGTIPSRTVGWAHGYSIIRVDKHKGLMGSLDALNLGISVMLVPAISLLDTSPNTPSKAKREIWAVDITDTRGADPEKDVDQATNRHESEVNHDACMACCFNASTSYSDQQTRVRANEYAKRKVLTAADFGELK